MDTHDGTIKSLETPESAYATLGLGIAFTPILKVGAECRSSARPDLCGGPNLRPVPTATFQLLHNTNHKNSALLTSNALTNSISVNVKDLDFMLRKLQFNNYCKQDCFYRLVMKEINK